jgi:hypothetical protein
MEPNQTPMDPAAMQDPAIPSTPATPADPATATGLATPEEIAALNDMMDKIEEKYRQMNAENFAGGNQTESFRKDLVTDIFKALQDAGIDITNTDSVRQFLDELEQSNPDLYELFVEAFNGLLGEGSPEAGVSPELGAAPETGVTQETAPVEAPAPGGALGAMPGGVPSNEGLAGMLPPTPGGIAGRFPNLGK